MLSWRPLVSHLCTKFRTRRRRSDTVIVGHIGRSYYLLTYLLVLSSSRLMSSRWWNVCYETTACRTPQSGLADNFSGPPTWPIIIDGLAVCVICSVNLHVQSALPSPSRWFSLSAHIHVHRRRVMGVDHGGCPGGGTSPPRIWSRSVPRFCHVAKF